MLLAGSEFALESAVNHLDRQSADDGGENSPENTHLCASQQARPNERARENPEHDRHRQPRVDVTPAQLDAGSGRSGYADHEI